MKKRAKRHIYITHFFYLILIEYACYLFAGTIRKGETMYEWYPRFEQILHKPFGWYYNGRYTLIFLLIGALITSVMLMLALTKPNFMPGKEYGTAKWGDAEDLTKKLTKKKTSKEVKIFSENFRIGTDANYTGLNNNGLIIGGSGARKTWAGVQPNLWQENGSYLITDPKGELLSRNGKRLIEDGYTVRVFNLIDMQLSDRFDPFAYIRTQEDISSLINGIMKNTDGKEKQKGGDPFWEHAEAMLLESVFSYVWMEEPVTSRKIRRVVELLGKIEVSADGIPSEYEEIMMALESRKGADHPAVRKFNNAFSGAKETIGSIVLCAKTRLSKFESEGVKALFDYDDFQFGSLGVGMNADGTTKTAIFVVIPDNDTNYDFIAGIFYTMAYRELTRVADGLPGHRLPIPVAFWWDEFANIALPDDFLKWIATCRSRNISCNIIIQNIAQLKGKYDKEWEEIPGNCDVLLYLGGNEQGTHEYISKLLGKTTIYKKSYTVSKGAHGSSSQTTDVLGRDLMTIDEVASMSADMCIIKVRGCDPILDQKYNPFKKKDYEYLQEIGEYKHKPMRSESVFKILSPEEFAEIEKDALRFPDRIHITTLTIDQLKTLLERSKQQSNPRMIQDVPYERKKPKVVRHEQLVGASIAEIISKYKLTEDQKHIMEQGIERGLNDEQIICLMNKPEEERPEMMELFARLNNRGRNC